MTTKSTVAGQHEDFENSKAGVNNSSGNGSGAVTVANSATSSSFTRRATGPRTPQGKERSKFNARKHDLFSKAVLLSDESRPEYDVLLNGFMETFQPQGKVEIVLVQYLVALLWRKRRLIQVETAEIEKKQFLNWDLELQNKLDELEYAQLKDASDAKFGHSNPLLLIRNAIEILHIYLNCVLTGDPQSGDTVRRMLKSIYGYQDEGPEPYGWRQMLLMVSKLVSSAGQGKEDSENPPDVKQKVAEAISKEMMRLAELHETVAAAEARRRFHNLAAARVPSQEVSDRLIRNEAHLSREFERTLNQLKDLQRMRLGQPVLPKLEVRHSLS